MLTVTVTATGAGHAVVVHLPADRWGSRNDHRGRRSEPDRPRDQGIGMGCRLVHRAVRPHAPGALPAFEEGHGCALRKDSWRSRSRRRHSCRGQGRSCHVRGRVGRGEGRGSSADRRRSSDVGGRAHCSPRRGQRAHRRPSSRSNGRCGCRTRARLPSTSKQPSPMSAVGSPSWPPAVGPTPTRSTASCPTLMAGGAK